MLHKMFVTERKIGATLLQSISPRTAWTQKKAKSWHPRDAYQSTPAATSETETPVTSPNPVYRAGAETVNGFDIRALYPEAQQPAAEQRNQGEAGSGFDIRQLYPDIEQPSSPASPSILKGEQVDALLPADQRNTLEQFASSKGLQVQYINDPDSPVSGSIQGNTMTINLGNGSYALGTAIHEVGHAMKAGDGKAFAEFQAAVLRLADTDPGLRRVAAGIVDAYLGDTSPARASMLNEDGSINRAALNEEVALKLAEELVQDPEQLIRTVSQDRTLIARFLDFVRKIKNSVSIRFTGSQKAMLDEAERTLENMLRGQAGEVGENRYSYIGVNANLTDAQRRAFDEAQQLDLEGYTILDIYQQTGWFRGADGEWRTELDDSSMKNNGTPEQLAAMIDSGKAKLGDVLYHPTLFEAYPQLRQIGVRFAKMPDEQMGSYIRGKNEISLNETLKDVPEDVFLHEIQHIIQNIENFASGNTPKNAGQALFVDAY